MADDTTLPGTGDVIAADEILGVKYQRVKIVWGVDGTATETSASNPFPVTVSNASIAVTGTFFQATQPVSIAGTVTIAGAVTNAGTFAVQATEADGANTTLGAKADAKSTATDTTAITAMSVWKQISASIQAAAASLAGTLTVGTHAVTQSGTWTVQPGNTANTTAWKVDGSAVAQPVTDNSGSLTVDAPVGTPVFVRLSDGSAAIATLPVSLASVPSHAVTNAGTFAVQASEADGANVTLGSKADAKSTATDTTSITAMSVWKQISASVQSLVTGTVLAAGSALIGRAVADASAATGGIPSTARLLSAAGTSGDATNVKASAGRVYAIQGVNVRTSAVYLKLYNSASAPTAGSGTPVKTLYLPTGAAFAFDWPLGLTFSTGIGFTLVTGSADNSSTSVTAADILALNIDYA